MQIQEIGWLPEGKVTQHAAIPVLKNRILGNCMVDPRASTGGGRTLWMEYGEWTTPYAGKITHWVIRKYTGTFDAHGKLKILYKHGTLYDCEGESALETIPLAMGLYRYDCDIDVAAGRVIGIYLAEYIFALEAKTGYTVVYYTGDLTGTNKTASGSLAGYILAEQGVLRY